MAGSLSSLNRWLGLEQSSNVVRTVVAGAPMSPSGTTYTVLIVRILVIFIPTVAVYQACL